MSPREIRESAIDLSGQSRVLIPLSGVVTALMVILGIKVVPSASNADEINELTLDVQALVIQLENFVNLQSGIPQRVHNLELSSEKHSGGILRNAEDIDRLEGAIDRYQWPGEIGGTP